MKKYPHGLTLNAVCAAIDDYQRHEDSVPEEGILAAFKTLLGNSDIAEAIRALELRAEAAEAKLAERDKQMNPDYFLNRIESSDKWGPEVELRIYESQLDASKSQDDHGGGIIELFTRPAPADDLAEMCDRQYIAGLHAGFRLGDAGDNEGLNKAAANYRKQIIDGRQSTTCAAILRNIEEEK